MKLRKALDRAKAQRDEQSPVPGATEILSPEIQPSTPAPGPRVSSETNQWQPPKYADSATSLLDPGTAEKNRGVCLTPDPEEVERYKILRTRISNMSRNKKMNTIMVTSPTKGEGKTVTCINMGFTFARAMNQTVLLVDCDFKGQDIHRYLGIDSSASLIDYFLDDRPIKDLIVWPGVDKLTLISGNRTITDSSELLSSEMMEALVQEMGARYNDRYVFFDAPPVLGHAEAISMAPLMDGILMVVEAGKTSRKEIKHALALLPREKFLGFVLNKQAA